MQPEVLENPLEIMRAATTEPEATTTPELASVVYHGPAGRYVDLLQQSTEAPREYRLAAVLTTTGALIGRRAYVVYSRPTYANFFTLLVGRTADARKTTVMNFSLDLMQDVAECTTAKVKPLYGLASVEGLAAAMKDGDSPEPYRIVAVEDELKSLLRKSQQKSVGNLLPRLTELYNCGRMFEVNTKSDKAIIVDPFLCIVSGSTPAWFAESIGESEISGGFLNRWTMFTGKPEKLIPFPSPPDPDKWDALVQDLAGAVQEAHGEYTLTAEAREVFSDFYRTFRRRKDDGLRAEATARTDLHAIKFGLTYAVLDRHRHIEVEDIGRGITLASFCMETAFSMVSEAGMSWGGAQERKVLEALKGGRMSTRELMRRFSMSADDLNRIARALERVGLVEVITERTLAGRRRVFLEAA
jgi:hypothetical protein